MASEYSVTLLDYSREKSSVRFNTVQITAANFDAQMTAMLDLRNAIDGITLGAIQSERRVAQNNVLTNVPPLSTTAQRESKWLAVYVDTVTGLLYRNEIPTADPALLSNNSDRITSFPAGALGTFKTAFEAVVRSPAGNTTSLQYLEFVGKRL